MDFAGNRSWKSSLSKRKEKQHEVVLQELYDNPGKFKINGLSEKILYKRISPKNKGGKEVADILFVTSNTIFVIEVTFGGSRKQRKDSFKLKKSRNFFADLQNKEKFLKKLGVNSSHHTVRGIIASYEGRWIHEGPQIIEDFTLKDA